MLFRSRRGLDELLRCRAHAGAEARIGRDEIGVAGDEAAAVTGHARALAQRMHRETSLATELQQALRPLAVVAEVDVAVDGRVRELLDQEPDAVHTTGDVGMTPLQAAASSGHLNIVKLLLERGADIDQKWSLNQATPLLLALHSKHPDVAKYLIQQGADVRVKDTMGRTPLKYATDHEYDEILKLLHARGLE